MCSRCRESKTLDDFYIARASKDGRQARCKECCKSQNNLYRGRSKARAMGLQSASAGDEEIELELIGLIKQLQQRHSVKINVSIRAGLIRTFSVVRT